MEELKKLQMELKAAKVNKENAEKEYKIAQHNVVQIKKEAEDLVHEKSKIAQKVDEAYAKLTKGIEQLTILDFKNADVKRLKYTMEDFINISSCQYYVYVHEPSDPFEYELRLEKDNIRLYYFDKVRNTCLWEMKCPYFIVKERSNVSVMPGLVCIRIAYRRSQDKVNSDTLSMYATFSDAEVEADSYRYVGCRQCGTQLQSPCAKIEKAMPLPSTNWAVMTEFWGVGEGGFAHFPKDTIQACEGRCYVGEAYLLFHCNDINSEKIEYGNKSELGRILHCKKCSNILGHFDCKGNGGLNFGKQNLLASSSINDLITNSILKSYSSNLLLYTEMLEVAESAGCFTFIVTSPDSKLFLQLLSWNTTLSTQDSEYPQRVLKVLYDVNPTSTSTETHHSIHLEDKSMKEIVHRLKQTNALLPKSVQELQRLSIGYLRF